MKTKFLLKACLAWMLMTFFCVQVGYAAWASLGPSKTIKIGQTCTIKADFGDGYTNYLLYFQGGPVTYNINGTTATVTGYDVGVATFGCRFWGYIPSWSSNREETELFCKITVIADPPTAITLNKTSLSMQVNETALLTADVVPSTARQKVTYEVLDEGFNVASVSSSGFVTAKAPGEATVRVKSEVNPSIYQDCKVTVYEWPTSVDLDRTKLDMEIGDTAQLRAIVSPEGADPSVTWTKESGSNVITLSSTGLVTAEEVGTVNVMAQSTINSSAYKNCTVTVKEPTLRPGSWSGNLLTVGENAANSTNIVPYNSYYKYSTTQMLYTPTEIGKSGKIKSIAFKVANATNHTTSKLRVYLGHKSNTFGSYVSSSDLTLVFSGTPLLGHANGWETLVFNQGTFNYNGTDNLVVVITKEAAETARALEYYCYYGNGYTLYRRSDSSSEYANVSNTSISYTATTYRPAIRMEFEGVPPTGIELNYTSISLKMGETKQLIASVLPSEASQDVVWSSNNSDVATVEEGKVTAQGPGDAIITASTTDNPNINVSCNVTVLPAPGPDTDISRMDNVVYLEKKVANAGASAILQFQMKNSAAIRGFQFDLYLPEGVMAVKNAKGRIQGALSSGRLPEDDEHTLTIQEQPDGAIRFLCNSLYDETFTGQTGEVATLQVKIAEDMEEGDYPIIIKNMKLTETNISNYYETDYLKSTLSITSYIPGDVNGDTKVDVSDYTGVANHIVGIAQDVFVEKAGDVDKSGMIDVADYTGIANLIMTGSIYGGSNNVKPESRRLKAQATDYGENYIFVKDVELPIEEARGAEVTLSLRMENTAAIRGFQFDMYLPEGFSAVKNNKGRIVASLSSGRLPEDDEHTLTVQEQPDGAIRFLCSSLYDETFTGNSGEIATVKVKLAENITAGNYKILLRNMKLTETNISNFYETDNVETIIKVEGGAGTKVCAKPTISYANGKLTFSCETEGAICQSTITDTDIASYSSNEVQLGVTYNISVYAKRDGYADSDVATATLCWIEAEPRTEGLDGDAVTEVKAQPVLVQAQGGTISVQGIDNGMEVSVFSIDGKKEGSAISISNQAVISTNLTPGSIAVVKIDEKAIKVLIK